MNELLQLRQSRQAFVQVPCTAVRDSANRLDASSYCGKSASTRQLIANGSLKADRLGDLAAVTQPTVFGKRFMVGTSEGGIPLYPSGELLNYEPQTDSFIARRNASIISDLIARPGTLLFTRSGSVGRVVLTPTFLEGQAIQDDVLKVVPETRQLANYLYVYFSSPIGRSLLSDAAFGSVIQHIKVDHVRELPVFRTNVVEERAIAQLIESAVTARARARELLHAAQIAVLEANHLPPLSGPVSGWLEGDIRHIAFQVNAEAFTEDESAGKELRLEANFFNPIARSAIANIVRSPSKKRSVRDLTSAVFFCNRFTRTFVEQEHGIPYLMGKNIVQVRPQIDRFLSFTETEEMESYKLKPEWTLVSCSGTIGRTCFVWKNFEKCVATHDLIRVVADKDQVDPGYLYAFLSSPYGHEQIQRFRHGSVVDHVTPEQIAKLIVPLSSPTQQLEIGNYVRQAYNERATALRLEDEAQEILMREFKDHEKDRQHV